MRFRQCGALECWALSCSPVVLFGNDLESGYTIIVVSATPAAIVVELHVDCPTILVCFFMKWYNVSWCVRIPGVFVWYTQRGGVNRGKKNGIRYYYQQTHH